MKLNVQSVLGEILLCHNWRKCCLLFCASITKLLFVILLLFPILFFKTNCFFQKNSHLGGGGQVDEGGGTEISPESCERNSNEGKRTKVQVGCMNAIQSYSLQV